MTTYEAINTIINALVAIGTVGAVLLSLWFSNRSEKVRLKVFVSFTNSDGCKPSEEGYVCVRVRNLGMLSTGYKGIFLIRKTLNGNEARYLSSENKFISSTKFDRFEYREAYFGLRNFAIYDVLRLGSSKFQLSKRYYIAWMQIKYHCKVVVRTSDKDFKKRLPNAVVHKILEYRK